MHNIYTVNKYYTGILFRLGDSNDLYHKLKKLIMDKNLRLQLGKNGRKRVFLTSSVTFVMT